MNIELSKLRHACLIALAGGALGAGSVAVANDQYGAQQQQQQPQMEVEEAHLDQFAEAFLAVQEIQVEASEELQAAGDEAAAQDVQRRAQEDMVEAVLETGLSVEEYNQIAQLMNSDPEVRDGIMERINGGAQQW